MSYYANICECGANFGDHFLFSEPRGAFFPETEAEVSRIICEELPFQDRLCFECSFILGSGEIILRNARGGPAI